MPGEVDSWKSVTHDPSSQKRWGAPTEPDSDCRLAHCWWACLAPCQTVCGTPSNKTSRDRMVFRYHSREDMEYHFQGNRIAHGPCETQHSFKKIVPVRLNSCIENPGRNLQLGIRPVGYTSPDSGRKRFRELGIRPLQPECIFSPPGQNPGAVAILFFDPAADESDSKKRLRKDWCETGILGVPIDSWLCALWLPESGERAGLFGVGFQTRLGFDMER